MLAEMRRLVLACLAALIAACSTYRYFDSAGDLRQKFAARVGAERARELLVPFELDAAHLAAVDQRLRPALDELRRVDQVLDFIFGRLALRYALTPTRNANQTFDAAEGNCLSFVNLFVGLARHLRLNPFYVEVVDFQRWNFREGMVVSQGHIVAGMYVKGELKTYDFVPYRPKSYRDFEPIDDLAATAHYYNNLGAEALFTGDFAAAQRLFTLATEVVPDFVRALNNLGVTLARQGRYAEALAVYERGLGTDPHNVALLTNQARAYQLLGRAEEAGRVLSAIDTNENSNPFFFLYRAELALAQGDTARARNYLAEALRRDSEIPEIHLGLVKLYLDLGDLDRARHHLERALRLDATNQEARDLAALLAKRAGK